MLLKDCHVYQIVRFLLNPYYFSIVGKTISIGPFLLQFEMSIVKKSLLDYKTQYRWYQVCYNIGVFISRSSITWVKVDSIWCLAILQVGSN